MKKLSGKITLAYAAGQLGWSLLAAIVIAQLSSIWTGIDLDPSKDGNEWAGYLPIPIFTMVFALSKVFDAFSDPIVGYYSDKLRTKWGRRIPFMAIATLPFAIVTVLIFIGFSSSRSTGMIIGNSIMLITMIILFYVFLTMYTIPYTSLISDLSKTSKDRVKLSTSIAITYLIGSVIAYGAPTVWTFLSGFSFISLKGSIILTMILFSTIGLIFLAMPIVFIKEKNFVDYDTLPKPSKKRNIFKGLKDVLNDRKFRWFIFADFVYWIGLIIFQSQVNFIVSAILGIHIKYSVVFVATMSLVSFTLYVPIAKMMNSFGVRKGMMQFSFILFSILFTLAGLMMLNRDQIGQTQAWVQGIILVVIIAIPMAILGIIENVVVSDVIEYQKIKNNIDKAASFYAIRNLTMKMGQAAGLGLGTLLLIFGKDANNPFGIRLMLFLAAFTSLIGFLAMFMYEEVRYRGTKEFFKAIWIRKKIEKLKKIQEVCFDNKSEKLDQRNTLLFKGEKLPQNDKSKSKEHILKKLTKKTSANFKTIKNLELKEMHLQKQCKRKYFLNQKKLIRILNCLEKKLEILVKRNKTKITKLVATKKSKIEKVIKKLKANNNQTIRVQKRLTYLNDELKIYDQIKSQYLNI